MKFSDFILVDAIRANIAAKDKEGVIRELVESIQDAGGIEESVYEDTVSTILRLEEYATTGIGGGFAVPHTKHRGIKRMVGTVAISREGVDFDSIDGEKVYIFILLLAPIEWSGEWISALELIAHRFRDADFCRCLMQTRDCGQIKQLLDDADNGKFTE